MVLQNHQRRTHLTESKHMRSHLPRTSQQFVEDDHFARVLDEELIGGVRRIGFDTVQR